MHHLIALFHLNALKLSAVSEKETLSERCQTFQSENLKCLIKRLVAHIPLHKLQKTPPSLVTKYSSNQTLEVAAIILLLIPNFIWILSALTSKRSSKSEHKLYSSNIRNGSKVTNTVVVDNQHTSLVSQTIPEQNRTSLSNIHPTSEKIQSVTVIHSI